jgi:hypothetical protein
VVPQPSVCLRGPSDELVGSYQCFVLPFTIVADGMSRSLADHTANARIASPGQTILHVRDHRQKHESGEVRTISVRWKIRLVLTLAFGISCSHYTEP